MLVKGCGQIASFTLPEGLVELERTTRQGDFDSIDSLRQFVCLEAPDIRLCLYYRGTPISTLGAAKFIDILKSNPHKLTDNELTTLSEVLANASYPEYFAKQHAQTLDIGSRRVLAVEGRWLASDKMCLLIMLPTGEDGSAIQEIVYDGNEPTYSKYLPLVRAAINSLVWF